MTQIVPKLGAYHSLFTKPLYTYDSLSFHIAKNDSSVGDKIAFGS